MVSLEFCWVVGLWTMTFLREEKNMFFVDGLVFGWFLLRHAASVQVEFHWVVDDFSEFS
jgi:hypothetical protein